MGLINFIKNIFNKKNKKEIKQEPIINEQDISYLKKANEVINSNLNQNTKLIGEQKINLERTIDNKIIKNINTVQLKTINTNNLQTIWDLITIKENTQAEHIIKSIPSDDWVTMDEIRHNIKLNYNIEYSNEKSLYPYLKTLTDINLIKVNNTGKKRSWKKNIILIKSEKNENIDVEF